MRPVDIELPSRNEKGGPDPVSGPPFFVQITSPSVPVRRSNWAFTIWGRLATWAELGAVTEVVTEE